MLASLLTNLASASSGAASMVMFFIIASLIIALVFIAAMWKVYEKAGKPGWAAIIPIYNLWVLFEIAGQPGWYALLIFIPFVGWAIAVILEIVAFLEIAKRFGKSAGFAIVLLLLIPIGWLMLGFGDAKYQGSAKNTLESAGPSAPEAPSQPAPPSA